MRQRANESGVDFIKRFREIKNLCFSLTLPDNQVAALGVRGLMPSLREKLVGVDYESLSQLAQKVAVSDSQLHGGRRDNNQFRNNAMVDSYDSDETNDEVAAEQNWGRKTVLVPKAWGMEGNYDFNVTKADKLFDFLLEKGQIKLPEDYLKPTAEQLKNKKFCKYHGVTSHGTNECRVFRAHIQKAIEQGLLKFDVARKMSVDQNPFPKG